MKVHQEVVEMLDSLLVIVIEGYLQGLSLSCAQANACPNSKVIWDNMKDVAGGSRVWQTSFASMSHFDMGFRPTKTMSIALEVLYAAGSIGEAVIVSRSAVRGTTTDQT